MSWTVIYYETVTGDTPIEEFLDGLSDQARAKCVSYMKQLEAKGTTLPASIAKHVRGKIWELRPEWSGNEYRFFYGAVIGQRFVILHAVQKKTQKLKEKDIELAEKRYADAIKRLEDENPSRVHQRAD